MAHCSRRYVVKGPVLSLDAAAAVVGRPPSPIPPRPPRHRVAVDHSAPQLVGDTGRRPACLHKGTLNLQAAQQGPLKHLAVGGVVGLRDLPLR